MGAVEFSSSAVHTNTMLELDERQFQQWCELMESRIGMVIPPERKSFLANGLRSRMREAGYEDYQRYYDYLSELQRSAAEWSLLVDRLTVHETRFFRHAPSIELLRQRILPEFLEHSDGQQGFQAWSLGCATGEEAYSLAMVLHDFFTQHEFLRPFGLLATDISQPALGAARQAIYDARRIAQIAPDYQQRYVEQLDIRRFRIRDNVRTRVCFAQHNVMELERFPVDGLDLIFCQNMLIYFDRDKRRAILDELITRLAPGGALIVGPVDIPVWSHPQMERIRFEGTLAYIKRQPIAQ